MELAYKKMGEGKPLIILHGLYGMSDNWISIGRELSNGHEVYLIDLRNHGNSPHADTISYKEMARDLFVFVNHHSIDRVTVLGHSMGGKTAMFFAALYPELIDKLIVVDISPRSFKHSPDSVPHIKIHQHIIKSMQSLDLEKTQTRTEISKELEKRVGSRPIAQFLMKNITRDNNNRFSWKLNLDTISKELLKILDGLEKNDILDIETFQKIPSLFIRGGKSDYLPDEDLQIVNELFPLAKIETIESAGHWLHAEQPEAFLGTLTKFFG